MCFSVSLFLFSDLYLDNQINNDDDEGNEAAQHDSIDERTSIGDDKMWKI